MLLHELPHKATNRPKIYGLNPNGHRDGWIEFDHLDGAYSYCVAYDATGTKLGVCHLAAWTPLTPYRDGYRIADAELNEAGSANRSQLQVTVDESSQGSTYCRRCGLPHKPPCLRKEGQ